MRIRRRRVGVKLCATICIITKKQHGDIIKLQPSEVEDVDEGGPNCWNIPLAATIVLKDDSEVGRGLSNKLH